MKNWKMVKVVFKIASVNYDYNLLLQFLHSSRKIKILEQHPSLGNIPKNKIKDYVLNYHINNREKINMAKEKIKEEWNKINDKFMLTLSEVLEIEWPKHYKEIKCFVSIVPVCPRFLKKHMFSIFFNTKMPVQIIAHEICHFLYFEKWKKIFKHNEKQFEYPNIVWYLSEILDPVILNDPRFAFLKPVMKTNYPQIKINGKEAITFFHELYKQFKKDKNDKNSKNSFTNFLVTSYKIIQKHKAEIKKLVV